jgi:hypothetical protein
MNKLELDKLIDEYNEKKRELQKLISEKGKDLHQKEFDVFFEEYPEVEKIVWTQYTPYFNDGDPCVFRVGELAFTLENDKNESEYIGEGSILRLGSYVESAALRGQSWALDYQKVYETNCELVGGKERLAEISEKESEISRMIDSLEEWLEVIYGDHVQVTVTKNGTNIEEYEHD